MSARSACRLLSVFCLLSAERTAFSRTSSSKGFSRNSAAPIFMASTANGTSPCPVTTMTGTGILSSFSRRSRSMPLTSGSLTSVMMQPDLTFAATARKAVAESYVFTSIFAVPSMNASESRAASSSSITCTVEASAGIVEFLMGHGPERKPKNSATGRVGLAADLPTMAFDDGARDRKSDTHAMAFRCYKGMKELRGNFGGDAHSGISHADGDHAFSGRRCGNQQLTLCAALHGFDCVSYQVQQDLLNLHFVSQDQ